MRRDDYPDVDLIYMLSTGPLEMGVVEAVNLIGILRDKGRDRIQKFAILLALGFQGRDAAHFARSLDQAGADELVIDDDGNFRDSDGKIAIGAGEARLRPDWIPPVASGDVTRSCGCVMGVRLVCVKHCGGHGIPDPKKL